MSIDIQLFDPVNATINQWHRFHEFRKIRHQESDPDDEFKPNEQIEASIKFKNPEAEVIRYTIHLDEVQVGYVLFAFATENSPSYKEFKDIIQMDLYILKNYRRQGIGMVLAERAIKVAEKYDKSKFLVTTKEESGKAFLTKIGAQLGLEGGENRLDLDKLDWSMMQKWVSEGEKRSPHTTMQFVTRIPDEDLEEYCKIYTEVMNQQPLDNIDMGETIIDAEIMRAKEEKIVLTGGTILTAYTKTDNQISGITELIFHKGQPKLIRQDLTGVQQNFRGQGIGKWLKAANILKAKELFPSIEKVVTGNADSNEAMLSINNRMGFYKYKETYMSVFDRSLLENAVNKYLVTP